MTTRNARTNLTYEPSSDSPFDLAYARYLEAPEALRQDTIKVLPTEDRLELLSCARSKLNVPVYESDETLAQFARDLEPQLPSGPTPLARARELYRGDWDENGTDSVHLPRDITIALLQKRGWTYFQRTGWQKEGLQVWTRDEALQFELAAEALS